MNIRQANIQDQENWNRYISAHPNAAPYHHFAWKTSLENSYGHKCYYLIAENENSEIIGVLPTASIKPPLLSGKLCSLPFCDLGASLANDEEIEQRLIDAALSLTTEKNFSVFEYRASENSPLDEHEYQTLTPSAKVRMLLDLPETSEKLLSGFKSKLRSQIRKAEKNGLKVELGRSNHLVDEFYEVFSCNMKDLGSPTHSKAWFREIANSFKQDMIISIVRFQGEPIGAGIVLFSGTKAAIPWASTKRAFNRLSPNMLLYWSLLEYATDNGYQSFDFGRSSFNEGTYKFKQQWGTRPVALKWKDLQIEPTQPTQNAAHANGRLRELVEKIWMKLPLKLTILLGPKVRKYISL